MNSLAQYICKYPNGITLTDQIHWWRQDGSFNGELYIRICELKKQPYNK